jgi:hypothetical protein
MAEVDLYDRFELLDLDLDEGVQSYTAREITTGLPVKVHLFGKPKTPLQAALLEAIDRLPDSEKSRILGRGEHDGKPYLVTDRLAPHAGLTEWLRSAKEP